MCIIAKILDGEIAMTTGSGVGEMNANFLYVSIRVSFFSMKIVKMSARVMLFHEIDRFGMESRINVTGRNFGDVNIY